jgi:hypothetical protein
VNDHSPSDSPSGATAGRIAGLIAANASLLVAVLFYMGWAYDNAYLGYFHLSPLDLDVSSPEYVLRSLDLFSQDLVFAAVLVVALAASATWGIDGTALARSARRALTAGSAWTSRVPAFRWLARRLPGHARPGETAQAPPRPPATTPRGEPRQRAHRRIVISAGAAITAIALLLAWIAHYAPVSAYLVLVLLAAGPVLLTWPNRGERHGLFPYALAIVVAAVCALWATSLYAGSTGTRNAQALVRSLPSRPAVVVYSVQRLALAGPGVTDEQLGPGALYHYEYQGLRLLIMRSGTYYLLPVGWHRPLDLTYVLTDSDQIRVVLLSG